MTVAAWMRAWHRAEHETILRAQAVTKEEVDELADDHDCDCGLACGDTMVDVYLDGDSDERSEVV